MVGVLVGDRVVGAAGDVEAAVVAGVDQRPGLLLLVRLAVDEVLDVRVVDVEDHHLGRAAGLAAALDDAGEGVEALHEGDRAGGGAAAGQGLARASAACERLLPVPEPYLKSMPSVLARVRMESMVSSTELMKQAEHCGLLLDADVEPDRRVEAGVLVEEDVRQLGVEGLGVLLGRRSSRPRAPQPAMVSATRPMSWRTLRSRSGVPRWPRKYFGDHHVGGRLRPELGHLDVLLLEDLLALLVRDHGVAQLPLDGVEGVHPGRRVVALEAEAPRRGLGGGLAALVAPGGRTARLRIALPLASSECRGARRRV